MVRTSVLQPGRGQRRDCGGGVRRRWKREESKSCLKGFTRRVSADCLQLPSAPPVVSLATVFPNLSTASLAAPPSSLLPPSLHLSAITNTLCRCVSGMRRPCLQRAICAAARLGETVQFRSACVCQVSARLSAPAKARAPSPLKIHQLRRRVFGALNISQ